LDLLVLATASVFAAAADLRQVFRIPAVFAAILVIVRDRATANRMRALVIILLVCHLSTLLPEPRLNVRGLLLIEF
jgi:hypothetical protein